MPATSSAGSLPYSGVPRLTGLPLVFEKVGDDRVGKGPRHCLLAGAGGQKLSVLRIRAVTELNQDGRTPCRGEHHEAGLFDAATVTGMHRSKIALHQLRGAGGLPKVLVQLQVLENEIDAVAGGGTGADGLETDCFVFHPGDPSRLFRLRFGQEVGLEASYVGVPRTSGQRVHVQAHEQIAVGGAEGATITESDEC